MLTIPARAAITGNPSDDLWTLEGSSSSGAHYIDGSGNYNADIYSTAFTLDSSSSLISTLGGFNWSTGDIIVGVGGVFNGANTDLTYNGPGGATSTRIVVKYGSSTATWSPGDGALASGGVGSVLLGTNAYDFNPANSGTLIVPTDNPVEQTSVSGTTAISGNVGRVITAWSGVTLTGFESFMNLTLLNAQYPSNGVALGNKFILDFQRDTGNFQDSLGTLPATVPEPGILATVAVMGGIVLAAHRRLRRGGTGTAD